jgi:hypothetical protein
MASNSAPAGQTWRTANGAAMTDAVPRGKTVYGRLSVTKGRHAGASLDVTKPLLTIGSALSANVVLTDPDVLARHAAISFVPQAANGLDGSASAMGGTKHGGKPDKPGSTATIEALDGSVLAGIQMIEPGQSISVLLPCTLQFGGCSIELTGLKAAKSTLMGNGRPVGAGSRRWWTWPAAATLMGAVALSLFGLSKMVTGQWAPSKVAANLPRPLSSAATPLAPAPAVPDAPARSLASMPPAQTAPAPPAMPAAPKTAAAAPPKTAPVGEDRALADLRQKLQAAGLDKFLNVERRGNLLVVDGVVSSAVYGRWREVKDALSPSLPAGTAAANVGPAGAIVTDLVKTSTAAGLPSSSVASVVLGKNAYVMSASGRRARVGEVLEDGWTVEAISAETVTMRRGQTVNRINPADGFPK